MNEAQIEILQGQEVEILEMILKNVNNQLELSWEIYFKNGFFRITFYNVSRLKMQYISIPIWIHGFEIIDRSQNGWEMDSKYEIHDFEEDCVSFFCESLTLERTNQGTVRNH